jgi:ubiquinone/menaquinone biosynthesis C-methylase UbiE
MYLNKFNIDKFNIDKFNILEIKKILINNSVIKYLIKTCRSITKLSTITQLFLLLIVIIFFMLIMKNNDLEYYNLENFRSGDYSDLTLQSTKNNFVMKKDNEIFDTFYTNYYDTIFLNQNKNNYEISKLSKYMKKNNNTKILDVGCGTGNHTDTLQRLNYNVVGLDRSKAMIKKAQEKYPKSEFIHGDILDSDLFDYNSFSHIICLGMTVYYIENKDRFFESCYSLLNTNGYLMVHLVDRENFKPYVISKDDRTVVYNPEDHDKKVDQTIIKLSKDREYKSDYLLNKNYQNSDDASIYSTYFEKFENFSTNHVRKNEINMYMPEIQRIVNIIKSKGFEYVKKIDLSPTDHTDEYIYIFSKA